MLASDSPASPEEKKHEAAQPDKKGTKRPMTSHFFFLQERRPAFRRDHPEATMVQITKALSTVWKQLTPEERKKYEDMNH